MNPARLKGVVNIALAALVMLLSSCSGSSQAQSAPQRIASTGHVPSRDADARLLDAITAGDYRRNMVVSPYGLRRLFGMLVEGARGRTHDEIVGALGVAGPDDVTVPNVAGFTDRDGVWIDRRFTTSPPFESAMRAGFGAEVLHVDFGVPGTGEAIGRWVAASTGGQVPGFPIGRGTVFVAIDALTYRVTWAHQFQPVLTSPGPFHSGGGTMRVPLMHDTRDMPYLSDPQGQYVRLPFTDGNSMLVALPKNGLTASTLSHAVAVADRVRSMENVELSLPRFSTRSLVDLVGPLTSLGVRTTFRKADFAPIFGHRGIGLSDVFQEGAIDVDEQGARMSAVSGAVVELAIRRGAIPFKVDRPFAFVVEDDKTQQVLVAGIVVHP